MVQKVTTFPWLIFLHCCYAISRNFPTKKNNRRYDIYIQFFAKPVFNNAVTDFCRIPRPLKALHCYQKMVKMAVE